MLNKLKQITPYIIIALSSIAQSEDLPRYESIVYDKTLSSSSKIVISRKDIENSLQSSLTQLVSQKAGLNLINGGFNPQSYYLRGGDSSHILILLDDMPVYDALSASRSFQMDSLNKASIQDIEVIKGSQTAIYGGQALVAVIKIRTINANLETSKSKIITSAGNFSSFKLDTDSEYKKNNTIYQLSLAASSKEAISAIKNSQLTYPQSNKSADFAILNKNELGHFLFKLRHFDENRNIVSRDKDAIDNLSKNVFDSAAFRFEPISAYLPNIYFSMVSSQRIYTHPINSLNTLEIDQQYYGLLQSISAEKNISFEKYNLLLGHQQTYESGDIKNIKGQNPLLNGRILSADSRLLATYASVSYDISANQSLHAGYRYNDFNQEQQNQQVQIGYKIDNFKVEYAEGFKTPTIFNLYDVNYGNINLKSEKAQSLSIDYDFKYDQNTFGLSLFHLNFNELISVSRNSLGKLQYLNISSAEISGVDFSYSYEMDKLGTGFNLTYQQPLDKVSNSWLERRPFFIGSAFASYYLTDNFRTQIDSIMNSDRKDKIQTGEKTLSEFWLFNLNLSYRFDKSNNLKLKGSNIFDRRYEESSDYLAEGRSLSLEYEAQF